MNQPQQNQKEHKPTLEDLGPLDQKEIELLYYIRTRFRYGDIMIQTRDGMPYRITKAYEYATLG